ncbi:Aromatic acid exporter family member 1 [Clostridium cavendishii DSM 21758]|uniref:Aromatic acid exporter family member 1 n=1 Tax=Clostridium cavendishii DSM 21758 TaxID=1121302 RepID=A0A1M6PEJ5_9CLOT|nr:aromatic acid exporter family protein [Clostridium cavendishii]SHK06312.1 Aromatic acid exporter family member 1 [Clostridium cavendishii DSM 21758]
MKLNKHYKISINTEKLYKIKDYLISKFKKLPKVGMRNIKTALAVLTCILLLKLIGFSYPFYACIAAVICMQDTVKNSYTAGKNRMIGTIIGGMFGMLLAYLEEYLNIGFLNPLIVFLGIISLIYIGTALKRHSSISISCIVFLAIMVNLRDTTPFVYSINRMFETFVGIIVAIIINKLIVPQDEPEKSID